jgi:hypothetical protein
MSDSIKKYHELVEDGVIDPNVSLEQKRENQILELLARAAKAGKAGDVERRAFEVQKEFGSTSLLLGLQVAIDELLEDGE